MNQIRKIRLMKNIQQKELANFLEVQPRQMQRYEKNNDTISVTKAIQIADYLNVPLDLLFNRPDFLIPNYQKEDFYSEEQLIYDQLDQHNKKVIKKMMKFLLEEQKQQN